ncbi:zinc ribbon domain-containing protein [Collinsella aerofaciens]|uniref:Zinc-ribbon domain-containing protein n=1 Tax=Collinsella aerofaciens TaxID=74426 RepID=A0A2D1TX40_9ACTN|nr:hypothetical protein CSV91_04655 [Collinsella aerofaciens]
MQCVACGKTIPDSMAFCPYCGAAQTGGASGSTSSSTDAGSGPSSNSGSDSSSQTGGATSSGSTPTPAPSPTPGAGTTSGSSAGGSAAASAPVAPTQYESDKRLGQIACVLSAVALVLVIAGLQKAYIGLGVIIAAYLLINIFRK